MRTLPPTSSGIRVSPTIMLAAVMQEGWNGLALGKALKERGRSHRKDTAARDDA